MPNPDGTPTEAEWLEGRYPGAQEDYERAREQEFAECERCGRAGAVDDVDENGHCPYCAAWVRGDA